MTFTMLKHVSIFLCSVWLTLPMAAAASAVEAEETGGAAEISRADLSRAALQSISVQLRQPTQMLGEFRQTKTLPNLPRPLQSSGVIALSREHGISWQTTDPVPSRKIMGDAGDQDSAGPFARQMAEPMMHILHGNFAALEEMFYVDAGYSENPVTTSAAAESWKMSLRPRSARFQKYLRVIELFGTDTVQRIRVLEGNDAVTDIELRNMQTVTPQDPQFLAAFEEN